MEGVELVPQGEEGKARDKAGEEVGVSGRYIDMGEEVIKEKPEMEEKIMKGEITVKQVYREIKLEKQKEEIEKLNRAMNTLSEEEKFILIQHYWNGLKLDEIGKILNKPIGTVGSLISRSKSKLKSILKGE